jgi:hypothetical protein
MDICYMSGAAPSNSMFAACVGSSFKGSAALTADNFT